jgi:hypothetical protein
LLKLARVLTETISVGSGGTAYSKAFSSKEGGGTFSLVLVSSAGITTISQQCGFTEDGTFYDPVSATGSPLGVIAVGLTVGSRFVSISPVATPWSRIKVVEAGSAAAEVSITIYGLIETLWRQ